MESRPCFSTAGNTLSEPGDLLVFVALSSVVMCATVTGRKWDSQSAVVGCWVAGCKHMSVGLHYVSKCLCQTTERCNWLISYFPPARQTVNKSLLTCRISSECRELVRQETGFQSPIQKRPLASDGPILLLLKEPYSQTAKELYDAE